jgi:type IV secretory pathway TraG/TraD family ATPase VirD4
VSEKGRALMMPDEIRRLDEGMTVVIEQGFNAYLLWRLKYWVDFPGEQFDENPMHQ